MYGTLRSEFDNPHARMLRRDAVLLGAARIAGAIFHLGRYPGLRLEGQGAVVGEVYQLRTPAETLSLLDDYEGSEYRRVAVDVPGFGPVWTYELTEQPAGAPLIASGDFLNA